MRAWCNVGVLKGQHDVVLRGSNQETSGPYNRRIVLESIRLHGPTTRRDIARRVSLTVQTVSTIVRELEDHGFILSLREEPRGKGVPPAALRVNPDGGMAVGIHITPLGIDAALVNLNGDVVETSSRPASNTSPEQAFDLIGEIMPELSRKARGQMLGVGMALPGPFGVESMSFVGPTTMAGWQGVALRERLAAVTGLPSFIEADMVAAALGEHTYGPGARFSHYYYLYFGVGLGGAVVQDGAVMRGAWGNAGEIGHIPVVPDGEPCPCGNRGCLERYLSLDAQRRQDRDEAAWVEHVTPVLRNAITTIENLFDPQTVVLGGLAPASLLERLAAAASSLPNSVSARRDRTVERVIVAGGGQNAVLRGAAALAVAGVLSPRFGQMFAVPREREIAQDKGWAA